ncbi:MAG: hypothetical protein WC141_03970 [Arcobacteraceae bacterium]
MAFIMVEKMCSCAKKRKSWAERIECNSIEEATTKAIAMCEQGNTKFCKKHQFSYEVDIDTVFIKVQGKK